MVISAAAVEPGESLLRLVARLDVKAPHVVKGVQLEGLRKVGDPNELAKKYFDQGFDEIYLEDVVASLYERNSLFDVIEKATENIFIPITVGGGVRSVSDCSNLLRAGADKVSVNTGAVRKPTLIRELADQFGSQCVVASIQAKRVGIQKWEVLVESGREKTGIDALDWAIQVAELGAGEILITSIDRDGSMLGPDSELLERIAGAVGIPVVVGGGFGRKEDFDFLNQPNVVSGVAIGAALHSGRLTAADIRSRIRASRKFRVET